MHLAVKFQAREVGGRERCASAGARSRFEKVTCKRMITEDVNEGAGDDEGEEGAMIV